MSEIAEKAARVGAAGYVLSSLLVQAPDQKLIENFANPEMLEAWPLHDEASQKGLDLLADSADTAMLLRRDHLYLITGVGRPLAEPHESARLSRDHLVFEKETLEVRDAYASEGFKVPHLGKEPDDHIGFEVAFLAEMATKIVAAVHTHDDAEARRAATVIRDFYDAHTGRFVADVISDIRANAGTNTYKAVADLLEGFIAELLALVNAVLAE